MAVIKVQASLFSSIKTVGKALEKMVAGDDIELGKGVFHETVKVTQNVFIYGQSTKETEFVGSIHIPSSIKVVFKDMTITPDAHLIIEGDATFVNVHFKGHKTTSLITTQRGSLSLKNCLLTETKDLSITCLKQSNIDIINCSFRGKGKAHIFAENSQLKIQNTSFQDTNHALWVKDQTKIISHSNTFQHQRGTQIILQNESSFFDQGSSINNGSGNGIFASEKSTVHLKNTIISHHQLPQVWIQKFSHLICENCDIQHGNESGIMLRENSEGTLIHSYFAHHKLSHIQVVNEALLHANNCQLSTSEGNCVHLKEKAISNFENCTFTKSRLSQLYITNESIISIKECRIEKGKQLGLLVEQGSNCTIVDSIISDHENTAITIYDAELTLFNSNVRHNAGNGILALERATVHIEQTKFKQNHMPHIAGKEQLALTCSNTLFEGSKGIYLLDESHGHLFDCTFLNGEGVQIEIADKSKLSMKKCTVKNGNSNAIKASKNSTFNITDCLITEHRLPQVVINDSSLILKNSEIVNGKRNGMIIENHSEAFIQDCFIAQHSYPQVWVDNHCTVEMHTTQLQEGAESDLYVQNHSILYANQCIIQNKIFLYNIQAVNHSKIELNSTVVENSVGNQFYMENNSLISYKLDRDRKEG